MNFDWDAAQKVLLGFFALTTAYFGYSSKNKDRGVTQINKILKEYQELVDRHKIDLAEIKKNSKEEIEEIKLRLVALEKSNKEKDKKILELTTDLILYESSVKYIPVPYWSKSDTGVMLYVNEAYVRLFLTPIGKNRKDYEGFTDFDIWEENIANTFQQHDNKVIRTRKRCRFIEKVNTLEGLLFLEVVKFPRFNDNHDERKKRVIGVSGIVLRVSSNPIVLDDLDILDI